MQCARRHPHAFTLLELVLVMVILCTALAVVAPSFTGFRHGADLRDAGDQFVALTRYARTQAAASGTTHRLQIDERANTYQLFIQNGETFAALGTSWGKAFTLPDGAKIEMTKTSSVVSATGAQRSAAGSTSAAASSTDKTIDFFPSGRAELATVTIRSSRNESIEIASPSPAEGFIVTSKSAEAR